MHKFSKSKEYKKQQKTKLNMETPIIILYKHTFLNITLFKYPQ